LREGLERFEPLLDEIAAKRLPRYVSPGEGSRLSLAELKRALGATPEDRARSHAAYSYHPPPAAEAPAFVPELRDALVFGSVRDATHAVGRADPDGWSASPERDAT